MFQMSLPKGAWTIRAVRDLVGAIGADLALLGYPPNSAYQSCLGSKSLFEPWCT